MLMSLNSTPKQYANTSSDLDLFHDGICHIEILYQLPSMVDVDAMVLSGQYAAGLSWCVINMISGSQKNLRASSASNGKCIRTNLKVGVVAELIVIELADLIARVDVHTEVVEQ